MPTFTVPGGSNNGVQQPPITYTYSSGSALTVAQQIANALAASGSLVVTNSNGGTIPAPTTFRVRSRTWC